MTHVTEAIYADGVLRPLGTLAIPEHQRVRIIIQSLDGDGTGNRAAAIERLRQGIAEMGFRSDGALPSRDELHDRH